jgi:AcrR family transcriptional regulator
MTTHRASRRQLQAEATRRDILTTARRLFAEHGYAATSMASIAEGAGAAVQTVYDSVGPKRSVLLALNDLLDEEAGVGPILRKLGESRNPRTVIALAVKLSRQFNDRCGDIIWTLLAAASIEPDVAEVIDDAGRRHRDGTRRVAFQLAEMGALRHGVTPERAGDILGVMTWADTYRNLTRDYGWTFDECEEWLIKSLETLLLSEPPEQVSDAAQV